MTGPRHRRSGFSSVELLMVLAIGALVIGASMVGLGTIVKQQNRVGSTVEVNLGATRYSAFYSETGSARGVVTAPNYGAVALAEILREQFNADVLSATAVFCLNRTAENSFHPFWLPYTPGTDAVLDTHLKFRQHLVDRGLVTATQFLTDRNYSATAPNCSIFILGYSKVPGEISVNAVYDVDVVTITSPRGFHASVKRFPGGPRDPGILIPRPPPRPSYYEVFYPASPAPATDSFTPLWACFERRARLAVTEGLDVDRFKKAAGQPFYLVWWPDPGAPSLRSESNSLLPDDPRRAYNHQGGRTSFMFTVPMFPSL